MQTQPPVYLGPDEEQCIDNIISYLQRYLGSIIVSA